MIDMASLEKFQMKGNRTLSQNRWNVASEWSTEDGRRTRSGIGLYPREILPRIDGKHGKQAKMWTWQEHSWKGIS